MNQLFYKYLTYIMKYADDDVIKYLISQIYGVENFYNPYSSYKELLLNLLTTDLSELKFDTYTYDEVQEAKAKCQLQMLSYMPVEEQVKYFDTEECDKVDIRDIIIDFDKFNNEKMKTFVDNNPYLQLVNLFKNTDNGKLIYKGKEFDIQDNINKDDINLMLKIYNNLFLPTDNESRSKLYSILNLIFKSLASFKVKIAENDRYFKDFINESIKHIFPNYVFIVEEDIIHLITYSILNDIDNLDVSHDFKLSEIVKDNKSKLFLTDYRTKIQKQIKFKTSIKNQGSHSLIEVSTVQGYIQSLESIDSAIDEISNEETEFNINETNCHICNPVIRNTKENHKRSHMCRNCKQISDILVNSIDGIKADDVRQAIKLPDGKEKIYEKDMLIAEHYNRLIGFIKKYEHEIGQENMKTLKSLISISFPKYNE